MNPEALHATVIAETHAVLTAGLYGLATIGAFTLCGGITNWVQNQRDQRAWRRATRTAGPAVAPLLGRDIEPADEPDLYDPRIGTNDDHLAECRRIWNRTPREEQ